MAVILAALALLPGAKLPRTGPLPQAKPEAAIEAPAAPQPEKKQEEEQVPKPAPAQNLETLPAASEVPTPQLKPSETPAAPAGEKFGPPSPAPEDLTPKPPTEQTLEEQHLTVEPESDADHAECTRELQSLGVVFRETPRIDDDNGCGIDKPIIVSQALPGIALKPEATLRCPTALALARWMKGSVIPAALVALPESGGITAINQASAYICRLRNGADTGKMSEHARGNAIDIASFSFKKGEDVAVRSRRDDSTLTGAFQRTVSAAGCLYFTTVLDPESDAAHETHFHLDVIERKGGFRYCH
ncbi:extensin family protein [Rhizobium mesosinicum]|uniref:Extensin family protein n=2 Tax=Rhizobium mesosinicum TaxID=335017 RepID=A0ABS7GYS2_9HYPH|nr:extensin family protein [Rhizobium mesosinicum]MBW9055130.1 extensin family protein [Rhizobium mesosinicum]